MKDGRGRNNNGGGGKVAAYAGPMAGAAQRSGRVARSCKERFQKAPRIARCLRKTVQSLWIPVRFRRGPPFWSAADSASHTIHSHAALSALIGRLQPTSVCHQLQLVVSGPPHLHLLYLALQPASAGLGFGFVAGIMCVQAELDPAACTAFAAVRH